MSNNLGRETHRIHVDGPPYSDGMKHKKPIGQRSPVNLHSD